MRGQLRAGTRQILGTENLLPAGGGRDKNGVELGSLERDGGAWNVSGGRCLFALSTILCPSRPLRSFCVPPVETLGVLRANVCDINTLRPAHPDAASSSYSALPSSSQPQALAFCLSQCLSARCHPVFHTLLSRRDSASGQRLRLVGCTCRLHLRSIRPLHLQDVPVEPALGNSHSDTHTYFSRFALRAFREMHPSVMAMSSGRANQILDMPRASSLVGYAQKCP